jgi:alpha-L-fucosidase
MNHDIQVYTSHDVRYTISKSGAMLYATALGWPVDGSLTLHTLYSGNPYLPGRICRVTLLGTGQVIASQQDSNGLHLPLPASAPTALPHDVAYVFAIPTHCIS